MFSSLLFLNGFLIVRAEMKIETKFDIGQVVIIPCLADREGIVDLIQIGGRSYGYGHEISITYSVSWRIDGKRRSAWFAEYRLRDGEKTAETTEAK